VCVFFFFLFFGSCCYEVKVLCLVQVGKLAEIKIRTYFCHMETIR